MPALKEKPSARKARQGPRMLLDLLRLIRYGVANTSLELAAKQGITRTIAYRAAMDFWACELVHPAGWERHGTHWVAIWKYGHGQAAPHPKRGTVQSPRCTRANVLAFCNFWLEVREHPCSRNELADASGFAQSTISTLLQHARARRMVRVAGWTVNMGGGDNTPLYMAGNTADAPKPPPQDKALLDAMYWVRRKQRQHSMRLIAVTAGKPTSREPEHA
jgi:hypothetical protein